MFNVILGFILDLLNFQTDIYYYYYLLPRIENKFFLFMYVNKIWSSNLFNMLELFEKEHLFYAVI